MRQYLWSATWWAQVARRNGWDLCVVENSDYGQHLRDFLPDNVKWLQCGPQPTGTVERGKGAGEAEMLLAASHEWSSYSALAKVTGRLRVLNASALCSNFLRERSSRIQILPGTDPSRIDTRFFLATPEALSSWMYAVASTVSDSEGRDLESQSAKWLVRTGAMDYKISSFRRTPAIVGTSGTTGSRFSMYSAQARRGLEWLVGGRIIR